MNKNEIVAKVAEKAGIKKCDAEKAVDAVVSTITDALKQGDKVQIVGFGAFEVKHRAARVGEPVEIPASKAPVFKAGKPLKDAVN